MKNPGDILAGAFHIGAEGPSFSRLGRSNAPEAHDLPTREFSGKTPEYPNLLNSFKYLKLLIYKFGSYSI